MAVRTHPKHGCDKEHFGWLGEGRVDTTLEQGVEYALTEAGV